MIDENALIDYLTDRHPFGIDKQELWETILRFGGNHPFVTKDMLDVVLTPVNWLKNKDFKPKEKVDWYNFKVDNSQLFKLAKEKKNQ